MTIQRIALFAVLTFALVQSSTEATAGREWKYDVPKVAGECSCVHSNGFCIRRTVTGPDTCKELVADTVEQAEQYKNKICQKLRGPDYVWHFYKCANPSDLAEYKRRIAKVSAAGKVACGPRNYGITIGWEPEYACYNKGITPFTAAPVDSGDVGVGQWGKWGKIQ